jgi:peptidoglycan/xylan/chitin deacetylase (PgdA/CDA1 family)
LIRQVRRLAGRTVRYSARQVVYTSRRASPLQLGAVLLYHRVADLDTDAQLLAVSPRNFAEHLQVMRRHYLPVRLDGVPQRAFTLPSRARPIAVTIDDGYADNLYQALPLLRAADVPATIFVTSGQVGRREEFWWDELERIILEKPDLPELLEVSIGTKSYSWHLPAASEVRDPRWTMESAEPCSPRQAAYRELCHQVRPLGAAAQQAVLEHLRDWAGLDASGRPHKLALSDHELQDLASDGLVEVGSHTLTHPVLAAQPVPVQREEIVASKRELADRLGAPIRSFAYPFGGRDDYTHDTVALVKEAGYTQACSNFMGTVHRGTSRHEIPRFLVRNWTGEELARRLHTFLGG